MQDRGKKQPQSGWKLNYSPKKVIADFKVTGLELINNATGETEMFNTDGVFVAIGREPNTAF